MQPEASTLPNLRPGSVLRRKRRCLVPGRRKFEAAALPQPLRSALAVSHDLDGLLRSRPSQVSPGGAHGVCSPCRVAPASPRSPPSPASSSPPGVGSSAPASPGLRTGLQSSAHTLRCTFRGLLLRSDRHRSPPVSLWRGFDPLVGFLGGTALRCRPKASPPVRSRHVPTFQRPCELAPKCVPPCRKKLGDDPAGWQDPDLPISHPLRKPLRSRGFAALIRLSF